MGLRKKFLSLAALVPISSIYLKKQNERLIITEIKVLREMQYFKTYNDILYTVNDLDESTVLSFIIDRFIFEYKQFNEAVQISQQYLSDTLIIPIQRLYRILAHLKKLGYIDYQRDYKRNLTTTIFILCENSKQFFDEILKDRIITNNNKKKKANEK